MNIKLKLCPFCGGDAEVRPSPNSRSEEGISFYEVRCKICGVHVNGESFNFYAVKYNKEKPQDLLSAVEKWNKRAYKEDERKTGKWEEKYLTEEWIRGAPSKVCPFCQKVNRNGKTPYCPHCGEKMEVDE